MVDDLVCWNCGKALQGVILPMSRREECAACGAEQHVCKLCEHFDPHRAGQCSEERAEDVTNKEQANFCDYFSPGPNAFRGQDQSAALAEHDARVQLAELFGEKSPPVEPESSLSSEAAAKAEFERLFGGGDDKSG